MKLSGVKIMREAERFLKRTEEYQEDRDIDKCENYQIEYVLSQAGRMQPETVVAYAYSFYQDREIFFYPFRKQERVRHNWYADFDCDLFDALEKGNEIVGMSLDCHSAVWETIAASHEGDMEHGKGMQMYLAYCKRNGITKQLLQEKSYYSGMDVMALYSREFLTKETERKQKEQER